VRSIYEASAASPEEAQSDGETTSDDVIDAEVVDD
jgi:hypothetical protein